MRIRILFILLVLFPLESPSQTAHDLRGRIAVDGGLDDYNFAEWIIDQSTSPYEPEGDSRWGRDNDIRRIALTWDDSNLYIAVDCSVSDASLVLLIDTACGGPDRLQDFTPFRRNIEFSGFSPNILVWSSRESDRPTAVFEDCRQPARRIDNGAINAIMKRSLPGSGAFEAAVPWAFFGKTTADSAGLRLPETNMILKMSTVITGGTASGAGDAAPDPTVNLDNDSTRTAVLDNFAIIVLDGNGDGVLDAGVEPRSAVDFRYKTGFRTQPIPELRLVVETKLFSPETGEKLRFRPLLPSGSYDSPLRMSASIYDSSGKIIRTIFRNRLRNISGPGQAQWEEWDGTDSNGKIVRGGIYMLLVSASSETSGGKTSTVESFAVIR